VGHRQENFLVSACGQADESVTPLVGGTLTLTTLATATRGKVVSSIGISGVTVATKA